MSLYIGIYKIRLRTEPIMKPPQLCGIQLKKLRHVFQTYLTASDGAGFIDPIHGYNIRLRFAYHHLSFPDFF